MTNAETVEVDLGRRKVSVPADGLLPKDVGLELGSGKLSDDIRSLRPKRPLRLDVFTECQNALHIPVPVSFPAR